MDLELIRFDLLLTYVYYCLPLFTYVDIDFLGLRSLAIFSLETPFELIFKLNQKSKFQILKIETGFELGKNSNHFFNLQNNSSCPGERWKKTF